MYNYAEERQWIFTDEGSRDFIKARDYTLKALKETGAFRVSEWLENSPIGGNSFHMLACIDRLVELKEIVCINENTAPKGQDRVYIRF